jgi:glycosyltransferase involved in cell wall biosynthesis
VTPAIPGVNVVGFVGGERGQGTSVRLGLGEVVRRLVAALEHAQIPHTVIPYRPSEAEDDRDTLRIRAVYDTNLICLNADYLGAFLADAGPGFFAGKTSVGFWFWETSRFRLDPRTPLACLDEVWVASSYVRDAVAAELDIPVYVAPLPMETPAVVAPRRADVGLPEGYLFLFVFNFVSGLRKNPRAVLEGFMRAFRPGEGPVLVLKGVNGRQRKPRLLAELERAAQERPDVVVIDHYASSEETRAIVASCDCYVSLHRSEGLGLTIAEAIAYGKPVIATGYSGNLDFMDEGSSYLVPYRPSPIPPDWWAYVPGAEWAEPDVLAAANLMRRVWEDPEDARARGEQARDHLLEHFTLERSADFVSARLAELRARCRLSARAPGGTALEPILEASEVLLTDAGDTLHRDSGSRVTTRVRRTFRRALWPYLQEQRRLDTALLQGLTALQRSVEDLEHRVARLEQSPSRDEDEEDA